MKAYARSPETNLFRYGSGKTILTERLVDGRLLLCDLRANGVPVVDDHEERATASFDFEADGHSMYYGWESEGFRARTAEDGTVGATLTLRNERRPLRLEVETAAGAEGFFQRTLRVTNLGDRPVCLGQIRPLQVKVFRSPRSGQAEGMLKGGHEPAFSVGHFYSDAWGTEGDFHWDPVPYNTGLHFGSRHGRSGHNHPFLVARDELYGGYFLCQMAWSANWSASVYGHAADDTALTAVIGPQSPDPARVLAPGETYAFPSVVFGMSAGNFDELIQGLHAWQHGHVFRAQVKEQPVIINHWGYMRHEMTEEKLKEQIDIGARIGGELFMVDAGWFGQKGHDWYTTTGDWTAGERLPNDLYPVFDYARSKGMKVGLWAEIETAGSESSLVREHPDWFLRRYGQTVERLLDLTNPAAFTFVRDSVMDLIGRYRLDMFRLDYNTDAREGGFHTVDGEEENTLARHVEAMYSLFDEVRRRFPDVQLENCSSGGGRTDIGMVSRFTTSWVSDWMLLPRTVRILNGMSMVLPPEYINRQLGVSMEGVYPGSLEAALTASVMGHPSVSGFAPSADDVNEDAMETIRLYLDAYRLHIRPMHHGMKVYHHTPVLEGVSGENWCALEYVSAQRDRAAVAVWRQYGAREETYRLRARGLDPGKDYCAAVLPTREVFEASGVQLMNEGLVIRLDTALTSRLLLLRERGAAAELKALVGTGTE